MNTTAAQPCKALSGQKAVTVPHLYVHVPFCATLCHYCAFYSEPSKGDTINRYLDALEKEITLWAPHLRPETIFFGGGTPTLLNMKQLERVLSHLTLCLRPIATMERRAPPHLDPLPRRGEEGRASEHSLSPWGRGEGERYSPSPQPSVRSPEFTFESNPATVSLDKARLLRSFGVNRISMGVQSFDERILEKLGRIHSVEQALKSYEILRQVGFDNVNIDLMFALPGQSMGDWEKTLRQAIALQPEHISTYCLTLEEDTVFWKLFQEGVIAPSPDQEAEMYQRTWEILESAGYVQYEISNFARPARECRHNIGYWRCEDCIGLGPSAASNRGDKRWKNIANTEEYIARIQRGESPADFEETLDDSTRAGEYVAFGLRMMEGVSASEFESRFGTKLAEMWSKELLDLQQDGLIRWDGDRLQLSVRGRMLADEVSAYFVAPASTRVDHKDR